MSVQFFQIYAEIGAGKIGTRQGVEWLWKRFQQEFSETSAECFNLTTYNSSEFSEAKHIDHIQHFFKNELVPKLSSKLQKDHVSVIISGDHSNAIGTLSALCAANPTKRIGALWIDAHSDLHTPYTTPSGNIHGMSLAAVTRQDNLSQQNRQVNTEIQQYWNQLKLLSLQSKGINPKDLCFLGLRSYENEEKALIEEHNIPHFSVEKIRQLGLESVLEQVKQQFESVDLLYVTFDVDALDNNLIPATGTPEPKGFQAEEIRQILQAILILPNIAMFELTEFNPTLSNQVECYERVYQIFKQAVILCKQKR